MKKSVLVRRFLPLVVVFVAVYLSLPRGARFPYDYNAGRAWKYETLFAEFDCPIYKTPEQLREERNSAGISVVPYYKYSDEIANKSISAAAALDLGGLRAAVTSELRSIYDKGIVADELELADGGGDFADVMYLQRDKRASKIPLTEVYRRSDALSKILVTLETAAAGVNLDSLFRATGLYDIVVPNVLYDEQTTQLVNAESIQSISPTSGYIAAGQVIVSKGEIVTADIKQMLDSYKKEFESSVGAVGPSFLPYIGNVFIAAALVILLYLSILFSCPDIFDDSRYLYVLLVFLIAALPALLVAPHGETMLHVIPFTLPSLMLQAFMKPKEVAPIYIVSLLPLLLAPRVGVMLFFAFALAGSLMMVLFRYFRQGWKQFLAALITFAVLAVVCFSFVASDIVHVPVWSLLVGLLVGSLLTVAGYPLVYLFERVFNLVSNSRLVELCNTSGPLIRTLEQKAPGTFQHSLQVMNMAEAAARAVGINPDLLRAGALYHDIGKSMNPLCFVENESLLPMEDGKKYHSGLTPLQSAQDIKRHVSDGIEIAQKNRLPQVIVDFIASHHGTTLVRYFYDKFLKEGGDPALASEFRYEGHRPRTKAQIILMLCDSMEAASRTLKDHSPKAYSDFVEGIIAGKMAEGQFDEADITIRELTTVKETIKQYLAQLNHERIAYPKNKSNKK